MRPGRECLTDFKSAFSVNHPLSQYPWKDGKEELGTGASSCELSEQYPARHKECEV